MNRDYSSGHISREQTMSKYRKKSRWNFTVIITFIVLPLFLVCFLLGLIGRASFNGLKKGWRIRF